MLEFDLLSEFLQCDIGLRDLEWKTAKEERPISEIRDAVTSVVSIADHFFLHSTAVFGDRFLGRLGPAGDDDPDEDDYPTRHIEADLSNLRSRLEDDLTGLTFLYIPNDKCHYWDSPLSGWQNVIKAFQDSTTDVAEASQCYATARYTAAVFHVMRVLERGVQVLGQKFGVQNVEDKLWGTITNEFRHKVEALPDTTPPDKLIKEKLTEVWVHLDHVRIAWRNPTMHPKQTYTEAESKDILDKVRSFMNILAPFAINGP